MDVLSTGPLPAAPEPEPVELGIEECAAIRAALDRRAAAEREILEEHELSAAEWARQERRWEDAIDAELDRGETALLAQFDAAYVAEIEWERGPIQVEEYARLLVAAERSTTPRVLADLSLPEEAELRVERVWLAAMRADPSLSEKVRAASEKARTEG